MSREYVTKEVEKIVKNNDFSYPQNIAMACAWIMGNFKGLNLKVLEVGHVSSLADYFVVASASNFTQAQSMADEISVQVKKHGQSVLSKEGMNESDWLLLDIGDVLVHIFLDSARDSYELENLWTEAKSIQIPAEYYSSSEEAESASASKSDRGYF